jgi:raw
VRKLFDRVVGKSEDGLTLSQCRYALLPLGYSEVMASLENLKKILCFIREMQQADEQEISDKTIVSFDDFCLITSYLQIWQQEISESTCVSPLKGTNLPPPPIFLTNTPGKK